MANYFDNSHIDGKQLTPQQIAEAIRHKKFGIDVRESMAQGLEYCMLQAQKVDKLEQDLNNIDKRVTSLETLPSEIAEIKQDIGAINKNIETIKNEITKLNHAVFGDGATEIQTIRYSQENHSQLAKEVELD